MGTKLNKLFYLSIYFLSPIIASIIYWFQEPIAFSMDSPTWETNLIHMTASIFGIFSYIWMCYNIIIMIKVKGIEKNTEMSGLLTFHTIMAVIALALGFLHMGLLLFTGSKDETQIITGFVGLYLFLGLMLLAIIFMTSKLIKKFNTGLVMVVLLFGFVYMIILYISELFFEALMLSVYIGLIIFLGFIVIAILLLTNMMNINKLRVSAYKKRFKYNTNKILHNITMLAVFVIFVHTLISFTARASIIMSAVYFSFFLITFIGWITHKLTRRLRDNPDPYAARKVPWDTASSGLSRASKDWILELIEKNPSLYPCIQCGTCTSYCPVAEISDGDYNPRKLIEYFLLGLEDNVLTDKKPNVWECTQCYSCTENCPQGVELPEIFIYIRNRLAERKEAPIEFLGEARAVYQFGVAVPPQPAIVRRREQLGLPQSPEYDLKEIQDILDMVGLNKLVQKEDLEEKPVLAEKPAIVKKSVLSEMPKVTEKSVVEEKPFTLQKAFEQNNFTTDPQKEEDSNDFLPRDPLPNDIEKKKEENE